MLDKLLISFKDNISRNTRNPFLGTLILVWLIRNWKIVFALFSDDRPFERRLEFIGNQLRASTFWEVVLQFGINVGLAIISVIIIYSLIYLTRYITNRFENQLLPEIYKRSAPKNIVLKSELEKIESEKERLEQKLKIEKDRRIEAESEIDKLEKEKGDNFIQNLTTPSTSSDENDLVEDTDTELQELEPIEIRLINKYNEKYVFQVLDSILNGEVIKGDSVSSEIAKDLLKMKYVSYQENLGGDSRKYSINEEGRDFWKKIFQ